MIKNQTKILVVLFLMSGDFAPSVVFGQQIKEIPNCFVEPKFQEPIVTLTSKNFRTIMNQTYSSIATGQGQGVGQSSYGSLDPVAGTFKLNYYQTLDFISFGKKAVKLPSPCGDDVYSPRQHSGKSWYLNLSVGGNIIGNNSGVLFNNSKFNSGTNLTGKLFIPLRKNSIIVEGRVADQLMEQKRELEYKRWKEKMKAWTTVNVNRTDDNIENTSAKLAALQADVPVKKKAYSDIRDAITTNKTTIPPALKLKLSDSLLKISAYLDSAHGKVLLLQMQLDSLEQIRKILAYDEEHNQGALAPDPNKAHYGEQLYKQINQKYNSLNDSLELHLKYQPYTLEWIALVGMFSRSSYYTYFDSLSYPKQIQSNKLSVFNYGLEFNLLHSGLSTTHYVNIGLLRIRNNNISDLSTNAVSQQVKVAENDTSRTLTQNYNAYTSPIREYMAWKGNINYYLFFAKTGKQAIHFIGEAEFRDSHQAPINFGLGYVFSFKNSKDNSVINVEAFVKFIDMFKALPEQQQHFYNRNSIGLTFGIPINIPSETKN